MATGSVTRQTRTQFAPLSCVAGIFLLALITGCVSRVPEPAPALTPAPVPTSPAAPQTAESPPVTPVPVENDARAPTKLPAPPDGERQPSKKPGPAPDTTKPATKLANTLDLATLEKRLRETAAIGVFTKIALKNQVDDLVSKFRELHQRRGEPAKLRQSYDLLFLKVLSLLQDDDPPLAKTIVASREAIWSILADPVKFSTL